LKLTALELHSKPSSILQSFLVVIYAQSFTSFIELMNKFSVFLSSRLGLSHTEIIKEAEASMSSAKKTLAIIRQPMTMAMMTKTRAPENKSTKLQTKDDKVRKF
jgi:hypothetical protein